ncbi:MAG: HD domain-containing protein [Deltaproteobacteria bacterium]|jgi:HD-GYP domain-containing protein (c-di-GMP phosphodiesterase class II)|nr:HD domain-containing protein [Deltaproteobacteria bacterium]
MAHEERRVREVSLGETVLHGLFRLLQVVKIHQANNRLFSENLQGFKEGLRKAWREGGAASFSLSRGRFYLNDERIVYTPTMWATSVKMAEFFQERKLSGLRFEPKEGLLDDEIVMLISNLNAAKRHPEPFEWLRDNLTSPGGWRIVPVRDEDNTVGERGGDAAADGGKNILARTEGAARTRGQARQMYSQALTVMRGLVERLTAGKKASIQKSKRIVEEFIDLLGEEPETCLELATVRDHADQLYTHSVNVSLLSMALGARLGYSRRHLEELGLVALLHDLGKAGDFLNTAGKSGELEEKELAQVRNLSLQSVARVIRLNAGYHMKLTMLRPIGERQLGVNPADRQTAGRKKPLSLSARILAVTDRYDAMTSHRPYRDKPMSFSTAIREMVDDSSGALDPLVARVFAQMMGPWPAGSLLVLEGGGLAVAKAANDLSVYPGAVLLDRDPGGGLARGQTVDLGEPAEDGQGLKRRIVACLNPCEYDVQAADYLLPQEPAK